MDKNNKKDSKQQSILKEKFFAACCAYQQNVQPQLPVKNGRFERSFFQLLVKELDFQLLGVVPSKQISSFVASWASFFEKRSIFVASMAQKVSQPSELMKKKQEPFVALKAQKFVPPVQQGKEKKSRSVKYPQDIGLTKTQKRNARRDRAIAKKKLLAPKQKVERDLVTQFGSYVTRLEQLKEVEKSEYLVSLLRSRTFKVGDTPNLLISPADIDTLIDRKLKLPIATVFPGTNSVKISSEVYFLLMKLNWSVVEVTFQSYGPKLVPTEFVIPYFQSSSDAFTVAIEVVMKKYQGDQILFALRKKDQEFTWMARLSKLYLDIIVSLDRNEGVISGEIYTFLV